MGFPLRPSSTIIALVLASHFRRCMADPPFVSAPVYSVPEPPVLMGSSIAASVLADWKAIFLRHAPAAFENPEHRSGQEATQVAELERLVGRLTLENDILKK